MTVILAAVSKLSIAARYWLANVLSQEMRRADELLEQATAVLADARVEIHSIISMTGPDGVPIVEVDVTIRPCLGNAAWYPGLLELVPESFIPSALAICTDACWLVGVSQSTEGGRISLHKDTACLRGSQRLRLQFAAASCHPSMRFRYLGTALGSLNLRSSPVRHPC